MDDAEFDREITLLRACWAFFDGVAARVSPEMRKGPRGGGRDRDRIIRHVIRNESEDFAKQVGLRDPGGGGTDPGWAASSIGRPTSRRCAPTTPARSSGACGSWTLPFLIRHSAFHTLDHAWEMEDKDLSGENGA